MQINTTNFLLILLGSTLVLCFVLMLMNNLDTFKVEGFDPVIDAIQSQLQKESPAQLKGTVKALQQRLIDYGYAPDVNKFVKRTELGPNSGKCLVATAEDRDKYISKSDVPLPGPRIDLSQYVKKSSIPPEKVCPPQPEIDYSAYVKKSTLPPNEKCPPCIAPKVKVSAGLCRECPPAPSCPPPERCPEIKCPLPAPCAPPTVCPAPPACPVPPPAPKCDEIRYIKVPAIITKTITLDANGNIISQKIDSGSTNPTQAATPAPTQTCPPIPTQAQSPSGGVLNNLTHLFESKNGNINNIPTTTFPAMSNVPNTTLAQTLDYNDSNVKSSGGYCPSSDLNSEFKKFGIY